VSRLIEGGFYRNVPFHRVLPEFVVQTGDPTGTGLGGPGFSLDLEASTKPHAKGVVSMARSRDPNSAGSQFYVCLSRERTKHLDRQYTAFGDVVEGLAVIDRIAATPLKDPRSGQPVRAPVIKSAKLVPAPPRKLAPDVPPRLEVVCLRCLSKSAQDRFASAGELAAARALCFRQALSGDSEGFAVGCGDQHTQADVDAILAWAAGRFDWSRRLVLVLATGVLMAAVFFVTTPGALWDPFRFIGHIYFEILNYTKLPVDHPYFVGGLAERFWVYAVWLATAVPSPWLVPSLALTSVAGLGALWLVRNERMLLFALLAFAAIYLWFVAQHPGVYVRNGLMLVPALALLFAAGCRFVGNLAMSRAPVFWPVVVVGLSIAAGNAYWLYDSAMSIRNGSRAAVASIDWCPSKPMVSHS